MMILYYYITMFHIFVISFCMSMNFVTYSYSNSFSTINSISVLVNSSNVTSVLLKGACLANSGPDRNLQDLNDKVIYHC